MHRFLSHRAVVAETFDFEKTSVGLKADLPQSWQVTQPFAEVKVAGIVDGRLGAGTDPRYSGNLLEVLLDTGVFVIDMQGWDPPWVSTRVRKRPGVFFVTRRSKTSWTMSGRPRSRFSRMISSKKMRPLSGRSRICVKENSAGRMDRS